MRTMVGSSFFGSILLVLYGLLVGSSPAAASPRPIRVRVQNFPGDRWHEGDFVRMTHQDLIVSWSQERAPDTLALRSLHAIQVSDHSKTSGWRTLEGLVIGATAGAAIGMSIGAMANSDHSDWSLYGNVMIGVSIGGFFGAFTGLIVGQSPVRVWESLDPAAFDNLPGSTGSDDLRLHGAARSGRDGGLVGVRLGAQPRLQ